MASRAEPKGPRLSESPEQRLPGLLFTLRRSAVEFYYQSPRLVAANLSWGVALLAILGVATLLSPLVALALTPLLAVPASGVFRIAAMIVREEPPDLSDAVAEWRRSLAPALSVGIGATGALAVLAFDVAWGLGSGSAQGVAIATLAAWGVLIVAAYALVVLCLVADPRRDTLGFSRLLRSAGLVLLAFPGRTAGLTAVAALTVIVSTVAFAALLTISVAYLALVAAGYLLPLADRLDARTGAARAGTDLREDRR